MLRTITTSCMCTSPPRVRPPTGVLSGTGFKGREFRTHLPIRVRFISDSSGSGKGYTAGYHIEKSPQPTEPPTSTAECVSNSGAVLRDGQGWCPTQRGRTHLTQTACSSSAQQG
eukprot:Sspe_Gene.92918::Locus_65668_Transcript_1_1_Confidence_1.000_Length_892::g.92918::m.92918